MIGCVLVIVVGELVRGTAAAGTAVKIAPAGTAGAPFERLMIRLEGRVDALHEERAQRRVRPNVGRREPDEREHEHADDEARPERQPAH